jgi:hypothetical protein
MIIETYKLREWWNTYFKKKKDTHKDMKTWLDKQLKYENGVFQYNDKKY